MLIREGPATELTVATRILAHLGLLAPRGYVAMRVGSEVVYLAGRGVSAATITPYDVCALRLSDAAALAGTASDDAPRYVAALRASGAGAIATARDGDVTAPTLAVLVERLSGRSWADAEASARAAGALIGAYAAEGPS